MCIVGEAEAKLVFLGLLASEQMKDRRHRMNLPKSARFGQSLIAPIFYVCLSGIALSQGVDPTTPAEKSAPGDVPAKAIDKKRRSRELAAEAFRSEAQKPPTVPSIFAPMPATRDIRAIAPQGPAKISVYESFSAEVPIVLNLDYSFQKIGNDYVRLRTYNNALVGPIIRVKAGQTLYLNLNNRLPYEDDPNHEINTYHDWNTTNIHYHGLHVAPQGTPELESDNVLLRLKPAKDGGVSSQKYAVKIPADHPAGTFWYHPHVHGSTTPQVASGASGALIVEREDDRWNLDHNPAVKAASKHEQIMVLQQIPYLKKEYPNYGEIENVGNNAGDMFNPGMWNKLKRYTTVNGELIPTVTMAPGEVRRFRFIASQQREIIKLRIVKHDTDKNPDTLDFHEIAIDGLPTGEITKKKTLELQPGYRSDSLVHVPASDSGTYLLINDEAADGTGADGTPEPLKLVAKIKIEGKPVDMKLPESSELAKYRLKDPDRSEVVARKEYAFYGIWLPQSGGADYFLSRENENTPPGSVLKGKEYDENDPRKLVLGQTQEWVVGSRNGKSDGKDIEVAHPFHIHINPFLITKVQNAKDEDVTLKEIGKPTWRDTLAMKQGYTYTLLTKYETFAGKFVDHCHILDHEDQGMMEQVWIVDPKAPPASPAAPAAILDSPAKLPVANPAKPTVAIFVKGSTCVHCMTQLSDMSKAFGKSLANLVVVSAAGKEEIKDFPSGSYAVVADPKHTLFREFGAYTDEPKHATFVLNRAGKTVLKEVGEFPFTDLAAVRDALTK